jgi:membrane associated rhomboid family serine protease
MPQLNSYRAAEKKSVILPLLFALLIPILLGLFRPDWLAAIMDFILVYLILLPIWCMVRTFTNWARGEPFFENLFNCFFPAIVDVRGVSGMPMKRIPWITTVLIFVNTYIFLAVPQRIVDQWVFPPYGNPSDFHILASIFTAAFLHGDFSHLLGNMMFLWTFGSTLEDRIGRRRFILIYLGAIVICKVTTMILLVLQANHLNTISRLANYHALGASGAVSGVMGTFIVRCYFARVQLNLPIFLLPAVTNTIKTQSMVVVGLFFALDLNGSMENFIGTGDRIGHWAHVGGYLTGFGLGYLMKLHRQAAEEAVEQKAERYAARQTNDARATTLYKDVLSRHPSDEKALRHFLTLYQHNQEKQELFFIRLMQVLMKKGLKNAFELMEEFFPKYCRSVPGDLLFHFGLEYYEKANFYKARVCLEFSSEKDGPWRAKSMLKLAEVMVCQGNEPAAEEIYSRVMREFSDTAFSKEAFKIKRKITKGGNHEETIA